MVRMVFRLCVLAGGAVLAGTARGQDCTLEWSNQFPADTLNGPVTALAVFDDDGAGPRSSALYVAGSFTEAGGQPANRIARWDGASWSALGSGLGSTVFALTVYDADGGGPGAPMLVAGGNFNWAGEITASKIAAWDGNAWWPLGNGMNGVVYCVGVFDEDGSGPGAAALFAGGMFTQAGSVAARRVARWNGSSWSPLGLGMDNFVNALAVFDDDGAGPRPAALYAAGGFLTADENVVRRVARWDGTAWERLASSPEEFGVNESAFTLLVCDPDGAGAGGTVLCVGGAFELAGSAWAPHVACWDGTGWWGLDLGVDGPVYALGAFDPDGSGPAAAELHVAGEFSTAGSVPASRIARWNGSSWSALGSGLNGTVRALTTFDDDGGGPYLPALFVGGSFTEAGGHASGRVARWGCPMTESAPVIATQPQSQMACPGATASFTVAAWGTPPLSYAWRHNGVTLAGESQPVLTISGVEPNDVGTYDVVVTNDLGSATSLPAELTLGDPPTILEQPEPVDACPGDRVQFWVVPDGTGPLTLQWYRDGSVVWGATSTVLTIDPVQPVHAGAYTVRINGACGTVESAPALLRVDEPPSIVEQPQSQSACGGSMVVLSVVAQGPPPLSYFWRKDGVEITGATAETLVLVPVAPEDAGEYDVIVSSACASTTSAAATLAVSGGPEISGGPQPQSACSGATVVFNVTAAGVPPLSYQWRRNGQPVGGATAAELTIPNVGPQHAGTYDVVVTDACAAATSPEAALTVLAWPEITVQPAGQTVCAGAAVTLSVAAGPPPLGFQWRHNGTAIPGANSSSTLIPAAEAADAGLYDVLVSNPCATVASEAAELVVLPETTVTQDPQPQVACGGEDVTFHVAGSGPPPLTYGWLKNGQPLPGENGSSLTLHAVDAGDAGAYAAVVSSACESVTSAAAALVVNWGPQITSAPQPQAVCEGGAVEFTVSAGGTPPLAYQWTRDGEDLPGEVGTILTIPAAGPGDAGSYAARITNSCGSVATTPVLLTVQGGPTIDDPPVSQSACSGGAVAFHVAAGGPLPLLYQWRKDGALLPNQNGSTLNIDPVQPSDAGQYTVQVSGACGSVESAPATLTVESGPVITDPPDAATVCQGASLSLEVGVSGYGLLGYQWTHDGLELPGATSSTLVLSGVTPADAGTYAVVITAECGTLTSPPAVVTVNTGPVLLEQPQSQAACAGATVEFRTTAEGVGPLAYQWLHDGAIVPGATNLTLVLAGIGAGDTGEYHVLVTDDCGATASAIATLTLAPGLELIGQPEDQAVCEGAPASFTVTASDPLATYQWRHDGHALGGETGPELHIAAAGPRDAGAYDVVVSGACGSQTSDAAALVIHAGPVVQSGPADQVACFGEPVVLAVSAAGTPPLQYQWRKDGAPLGGAVLPSLTIPAATALDAGQYDVLVTNGCGTRVAGPAVLTLGTEPSIAAHPEDARVCAGAEVTLRVVPGGTPPLAFRWYRDGIEVAGATGAELRVSPAAPEHSGVYTVSVTGSCGSVTSAGAEVLVEECLAAPTVPSQPHPADGAAAVNVPVSLSWSPAARAESYEVRFGRSNPPATVAAIDTTEWVATAATRDTLYYWQVVARNSGGDTPGPVWSFRTAPAPADPNDGTPIRPPGDPNSPPDANEPPDDPPSDPNLPDEPDIPDPAALACGGGGGCGAGIVAAVPLTLAGVCGMKVRLRGRRGGTGARGRSDRKG